MYDWLLERKPYNAQHEAIATNINTCVEMQSWCIEGVDIIFNIYVVPYTA